MDSVARSDLVHLSAVLWGLSLDFVPGHLPHVCGGPRACARLLAHSPGHALCVRPSRFLHPPSLQVSPLVAALPLFLPDGSNRGILQLAGPTKTGSWHACRRLYPDDRALVMEIQSLVKSGKMQRIKSNAVLQNARSSMVALAARPLDRKVSINTGAWYLCHAALTTALCVLRMPQSSPQSTDPQWVSHTHMQSTCGSISLRHVIDCYETPGTLHY